jgi:hypothetical protein
MSGSQTIGPFLLQVVAQLTSKTKAELLVFESHGPRIQYFNSCTSASVFFFSAQPADYSVRLWKNPGHEWYLFSLLLLALLINAYLISPESSRFPIYVDTFPYLLKRVP